VRGAAGARGLTEFLTTPEKPAPLRPSARLRVTDDRHRFRLAALVRLGLLGPHYLMLELRGFVMPFAIVAAWWCALVDGKVPAGLHRFLSRFVRYQTRVAAFAVLLADPFPGFTHDTPYPVDLELRRPRRHSRLRTVAYLPVVLVLAIPAILALLALLNMAALAWGVCLVGGVLPRWMQRAEAGLLSYLAQYWAFGALVTDRLPARRRVELVAGPWRPPAPAPLAPAAPAPRTAPVLVAVSAIVLVGGSLLAARALWHTTVPGDLTLPHLDPRRFFTTPVLPGDVDAQNSADRWLLAGLLATIAALIAFARRGAGLARHSAAGPIGTGMFLGMLALGVGGLAAAPFYALAAGAAPDSSATDAFLIPVAISAQMSTAAIVIAIAMAAARRLPRGWWLVAPVAVALLQGGFLLAAPSLDEGPVLDDPVLLADAHELARREGIPHEHIRFVDLRDETRDVPGDAFAVGGGTSSEVVLLGSLNARRELRVVLGHEIAHVARRHTWKRAAWQALFLLLAAALVNVVVRRRGALHQPALIPLAVLVFFVAQLAWTPLSTAVARRYEAEADWMALQATRDPHAMVVLMQEIDVEHHAAPTRPWWALALFEDHPDIMHRIDMAVAWQTRAG
jgi:STE24 endopeptidase